MKFIRSNSFKRLFSLKRHSIIDASSDMEISHKDESLLLVPFSNPPQKPTWRCFSFEEIFNATNGFSSDNLVGKGGYAEVFKGVLNENEEIAVKRLTKSSTEKEFLTEIGTIGHVCHPNVMSLLGCCIDNGLYLIFHFSSRGTVALLLHDVDSPPIDWKTRLKIAVGTANGLHYLHKGCQRRIIHRDIKSSNILLTADFEPQISDFGLAKWLPSEWTHHSIAPIEGTFGHLAPEYYMHGIVDEKTDVFAFGVFLLEIISGRKPVDGSYQSLHSWAKPILIKGEIEKLIDLRLNGAYDATQVNKLSFAASLCIRSSSRWRPTMSESPQFSLSDNAVWLEKLNSIFRSTSLPAQVLDILLGEIDKEAWKMPEEEEEFWCFDDLEYESDDDSLLVTPEDSMCRRPIEL